MLTFAITSIFLFLLFVLNIYVILKYKKYTSLIIILNSIIVILISYIMFTNIGYANKNPHLMPEEFQVLGMYSGNTEKSFYILIYEEETGEPKLFYYTAQDEEKAKGMKAKFNSYADNAVVMGKKESLFMTYPNLDFHLRDLSKIESK
jgi:hypothetical protein